MQYDMERLEQPLVDETQSKAHVWTDIGEAEVEYSIFGKAKVRVYRKRDEVRGAIRWTLLTIALVVGVIWLIQNVSRQPEIVHVAPSAPVAPAVVPEPAPPVQTTPQIKPRLLPALQDPAAQLHAHSAPIVARPLPRQPVIVSGASAPAAARPAPAAVTVATKPLAPVVPATAKPGVTQAPVAAASAVTATN
ncbi:MAG: hypothetical protein KKA63_06290 [Gammaproteobacteria bacterium]|nr:hypothetical protein [Gammaproteobacteria bacterium]